VEFVTHLLPPFPFPMTAVKSGKWERSKPSAGVGRSLFRSFLPQSGASYNPHPHPMLASHRGGRYFAAPPVNQRYSHVTVDMGARVSQGEAKVGRVGRKNCRCYESGAKNFFHNRTVDTGCIFLEVISLQTSQVHIGIASKLGQLSSNIDVSPSCAPLRLSTPNFLTSQRPVSEAHCTLHV
jgi:hypothetical protein